MISASFTVTWWRWLSTRLRVARSSITRWRACLTAKARPASSASPSCTSRSNWVTRRWIASSAEAAAASAASVWSNSRCETYPFSTRRRKRSFSRAACTALLREPATSAVMAASAARRDSSRARDSSTAASAVCSATRAASSAAAASSPCACVVSRVSCVSDFTAWKLAAATATAAFAWSTLAW